MSRQQPQQQPQVQPCRYKVGKTLGAGSYSVVKECVHIDTGRYYAAKVINKRLMAGREHMVRNEIAVLKKVSMGHQNILTLVDYFETMNNLYLIFKKTGHGKPVDLWAIGVITYFLLCGYTPFDRDSDFEEMQAILNADYSFTPVEYWRGVSSSAKDFIRRCLTIDQDKRITAHEALQHAFVAGLAPSDGAGENLLPTIKKNFNARRTLHAAIDTVRAINKLREAQNLLMDGARSQEPARSRGGGAGSDKNSNNGAAAAAAAAPPIGSTRKDDSAISMGSSQGNDGADTNRSQPDDVVMGNTTAPASDVPALLQPGNMANRVVQTSKGLWNPEAAR
ncbi:kinase-like protein [Trichoderma longibrachiatum ATCC 18648]|uniref:Kinase-like protein n=1 Tax=Trichoderma longibrachiatum ATCC 18648 TaxID=983965 RepID=A0A2T4C7E9_TRILO|nr:kinase-like protein [Trichoderma longibrachiatum ATCC 18648]